MFGELRSDLAHIDICQPSFTLKPLKYEWAHTLAVAQRRVQWLPEEIPLNQDIVSFVNLMPHERNLVKNILTIFTQSDIDIGNNYMTMYQPIFRNGEISRMLRAFAAMEDIHVDAYSLLNDTLGYGEDFYNAFMDIDEMRAKHDILTGYQMRTPHEIAASTALISGFGEGLQLFASFAMLMNFPRFRNRMQNMAQIVAWSIRDETLHCEGMRHIFQTFISQAGITHASLEDEIIGGCEKVVLVEDAFIDRCFEMGPVEGLSAAEMKQYIRWQADVRLNELGFRSIYNVGRHPLPWLPAMLNTPEHSNFFETRATEYSKAATTGNWTDTWSKFDARLKNKQVDVV